MDCEIIVGTTETDSELAIAVATSMLKEVVRDAEVWDVSVYGSETDDRGIGLFVTTNMVEVTTETADFIESVEQVF